eukprot:CAMPEP_0172546102 /NCGR_PEP_ID=MMETSP1067-20121228/15922_1 /TAXON_ID=265564 ORGANISM="Thalassiosira punctigera, Strain Tpunct2005C2" /NCGR_SAMPLE_ID=MMETSP1067 /ASSEMBLY_ACC=CAM_ASM_000444 /LENGTH=65 /DNA_ID=CAMNT_0013332977 /DNA_START=730 /DNA_END=927 /DNA_ORIENTATION=-
MVERLNYPNLPTRKLLPADYENVPLMAMIRLADGMIAQKDITRLKRSRYDWPVLHQLCFYLVGKI